MVFFCQIVCDRAVSSAALLCWPCALYCLHVGIEERDLTGHWSRKCLIMSDSLTRVSARRTADSKPIPRLFQRRS